MSSPASLKVVLLCATLLAACAATPEIPPDAALLRAYDAMKAAVAVHADAFDDTAMKAARAAYTEGFNAAGTDPERAVRLAQEAEVEAQLARARTLAAQAHARRVTAETEIEELRRMAHPGTVPGAGR